MTDGKSIDPDEQLREWAESVEIWSDYTGKPTKLDSVISPDLESCGECRYRVSRLAKICPKCGCTNPYLSFSGTLAVRLGVPVIKASIGTHTRQVTSRIAFTNRLTASGRDTASHA